MTLRRASGLAVLLVLTGALLLPPVEVNPITPSIEVSRAGVPLGSVFEITYTWSLERSATRLEQDYRALVRFVDDLGVTLFDDDHAPVPPSSAWQPGQTYSYTRTVFVPLYPYLGEVEVRMGLYPLPGRGERPALKGEDRGSREYAVGTIELRPRTESVYVVYLEGWHTPETISEEDPVERQWTKKEAVAAFKNPNFKSEKPIDLMVYLQGETCVKCFPKDPTLTVSVGKRVGQRFLIDGPQKHLWKIRVKAADVGPDEWTDLRLTMDQSFVPKDLHPPLNRDERELGLSVYHLSVADAALMGSPKGIADAVALAPAAPSHREPAKGPPPNDNFAAAIVVQGIRWSTAGTNMGATLEAGEPNHDGASPGASVWWRWTAPRSGMVRLTTRGSDFDTVLGVYAGDSLAGLKAVASNDDDNGRQSMTDFFATAGGTYSIAVAGYHAWTGNILLSLDSLGPERRPGPWRQ